MPTLFAKVCLQTAYVVSETASQEHVICKLLDCDTITQAKEKALDSLFRNMPFSHRPSIHNVDLGMCDERVIYTLSYSSWPRISILAWPHLEICLCSPVIRHDVICRHTHCNGRLGTYESESNDLFSRIVSCRPCWSDQEPKSVWRRRLMPYNVVHVLLYFHLLCRIVLEVQHKE